MILTLPSYTLFETRLMISLAYEIVKDLSKSYRAGDRNQKLILYFTQLAKHEARFNLDILDLVNRSLTNGTTEQLAKTCSCLRCELPDLLSASGILPSDVFDGDHQFKHDALTFSDTDERDPTSFRAKLKTQSPLYLYYFTYRKIDVLRSLGSIDLDPSVLINLKVRSANIQVGLCQFLKTELPK